MNIETWTGIAASVLTSFSSLPQLIKIIREHKSKDVSIIMLLVLITGLACWVVYGSMLRDWIIVLANAIACVINLATLIMTIRFR